MWKRFQTLILPRFVFPNIQLDNVIRVVKNLHVDQQMVKLLWLLPSLFVLHDFNIIFKKNRPVLWMLWSKGKNREGAGHGELIPEGAWEVARLSAMRWDGIQQATQACKNRHSNTTVMSTIESWWIIITSKKTRRAAPQLMEITAALVQKLGWRAPA